MKFRTLWMLALLLVAPLMTGCYEKVKSGHVGVKVHLLGTSKGVDNEVLGVGRYWIGMNEDLFLFPTFQQSKVWTADKNEDSQNDESFSFQTAEGMMVNTDIGLSYSIDPGKVSTLFQRFRKGPDEITNVVLRSIVRDGLNKLGGTDSVYTVMGPGKQALIERVQAYVKTQTDSFGIKELRLYLVGEMRPPKEVKDAISAKITATQKAQQAENELQTAKAQAAKAIAEAEGQAKANELKQRTLTKELIEYEAVQKWNGVLPQVTSGATPFINLK